MALTKFQAINATVTLAVLFAARATSAAPFSSDDELSTRSRQHRGSGTVTGVVKNIADGAPEGGVPSLTQFAVEKANQKHSRSGAPNTAAKRDIDLETMVNARDLDELEEIYSRQAIADEFDALGHRSVYPGRYDGGFPHHQKSARGFTELEERDIKVTLANVLEARDSKELQERFLGMLGRIGTKVGTKIAQKVHEHRQRKKRDLGDEADVLEALVAREVYGDSGFDLD